MGRASETKDFYEGFAGEVLLEDFHRFNLRQDAVRRLCEEFVPRGARVLEIGCGVGINVKHLRRTASRVVGVDISDRSIEIAKEYAGSAHAEFRALDILEGADELAPLGPFDVVVLPDVIEHVPKDRYAGLFAALERLLARPGRVLITYPSPEYQEYLKANEPNALQLVDETVELDDIIRHTSLELVHFSYKHVWNKNQYIHVVLTSDRSFRPEGVNRSRIERLEYRLRKRWWRYGNQPFLRRMRRRLASMDTSSR
jgi:2-polyprenyl-3-methyl-5-hydroxy-6-metoxy-1,4-benzoquinol methylase